MKLSILNLQLNKPSLFTGIVSFVYVPLVSIKSAITVGLEVHKIVSWIYSSCIFGFV